MTLVLSTLRSPPTVPPETRRAGGGEFTIGRGAENDWVLPDGDRHLSKRHCLLAYRCGEWLITDHSANGTFLNRDQSPIGAGQSRPLRDGDRLRLGAYEIELRIEPEAEGLTFGANDGFRANAGARASQDSLAGLDPGLAEAPGDLLFGEPRNNQGGSLLPADFDPFAPDDADVPASPTRADHAPAIEDAIRPPRAVAHVLPDDWDQGEKSVRHTEQAPIFRPPEEATSVPVSRPATSAPASSASDADLLDAFLRGARLAGARPADPQAALEALGAAFRALVSGLREAMVARATVKGTFRVEQTMIAARGNNPLKFAAGEEDAMAALLADGRRNAMAPAQAVAEALADIRLHELATMSAMQVAVRALVAQLSPAAVQAGVETHGLDVLPAQRKARAWDAYAALHARTVAALADDFDSVFGKAFARAYERTMADLAKGGRS
jgi:type VI secretion system FHA domain protein